MCLLLFSYPLFQPSSIAEFETDGEERTIAKIKKGIHAGFLRLDESMRQMPEVSWYQENDCHRC